MNKEELKKLIAEEKLSNYLAVIDSDDEVYNIEIFHAPQSGSASLVNFIFKTGYKGKIQVTTTFIIDICDFESSILKLYVFHKDVVFVPGIKSGINLRFYQCHFHAQLELSSRELLSNIDFFVCDFWKAQYWQQSKFTNLKFVETIFHENFELNHITIKENVLFNQVHFKGHSRFMNLTIHKTGIINFDTVVVDGYIDLAGCGVDEHLNFYNITVKRVPDTLLNIKGNSKNKLHYKLLKFKDYLHKKRNKIRINPAALKRFRESLRIIKNHYEKNGNRVEALKFKSYEMQTYMKELAASKKSRCAEKALLYLNFISNNFGLSWTRGVGFTIITAAIFFILYLSVGTLLVQFVYDPDASGKTALLFLKYLNITYWNVDSFNVNDNAWLYGILFIGRIFIGFGYYQTIQAFRKYGK